MENEELVRSPDVYKVPSPGLVYGQQGMPDHPSPTLRCPLPQVTVTPDSLRQFNRNGRLPQIRLLTPETLSNSGGGSGTVINNTGAGSGTTVNNNTIIASGSNNPPGPSSPTAQNASVTTPLLNPGDQYLNPIPIAKAFAILLISVKIGRAHV